MALRIAGENDSIPQPMYTHSKTASLILHEKYIATLNLKIELAVSVKNA